MLRSESFVADPRQHCRVLLELYLRNCGQHRVSLGHQMFIIHKLEEVAQMIKKCEGGIDKNKLLKKELSKIVFPKSFQLPLDPYKTCKGIIVDKCRVMSSKKLPLWLTFLREDSYNEPPFVVLFKSGDDLRQDQLTLQVLRVMDRQWKENGLDLNLLPYRCAATGFEQGMLEVVQESNTIAGIVMDNIQNMGGIGGKIKATNETFGGKTALVRWLEKYNRSTNSGNESAEGANMQQQKNKIPVRDFAEPNQLHMHNSGKKFEFHNPLQQGGKMVSALDKFTTSCAGYCVATYVLGIGDRHNGERAKRASFEEESSDESREMATTYTTELTLFHSIRLARSFCSCFIKNAPRFARCRQYHVPAEVSEGVVEASLTWKINYEKYVENNELSLY